MRNSTTGNSTAKHSSARDHARRGSALLAVLWLSAALAAIGLAVSATVRAETGRVSTSADGLRAWYLATGSVERGIQWMLWGSGPRGPDGQARYWDENKSRLNMSYPSGDVVVEMIPESSKLSLKNASAADLTRVVAAVVEDSQLAGRIAGGIVGRRGGGPAAPVPTFQGAGASFQEIEDLLTVPGMTPEIFYGNYASDAGGRLYARGGLRDSLSVWGSLGPFDINTVSTALLEANGVEGPALQGLLAQRKLGPFRSMNEARGFIGASGKFRIGGISIWTLRATARLRLPKGGPSEVVRTASAVVKVFDPIAYAPNFVHVLRFYDDAWSQDSVAPPGPNAGPNGPGPGTALGAGLIQ